MTGPTHPIVNRWPTLLTGARVALACGLASALLGLALPWIEASRTATEDMRLATGTAITADIEVDDTAHFLGEPFDVAVVVRYAPDTIEVTPESLKQSSFAPFELTRDVRVSSAVLNDALAEYRFSAEIRAIDVLPGKSYEPAPVSIEYQRRGTGERAVIEAAFSQPLHVTAYYGEEGSAIPLRPLRDALPTDTANPALLLIGSVLLAGAAILLIATRRLDPRVAVVDRRTLELQYLRKTLSLAQDAGWRDAADARVRLKDIESRALRLTEYFLGIGPRDFWQPRDDGAWSRLHAALAHRYQAPSSDEEDVQAALAALADVLASVTGRQEAS